jgi:membrane-associated protease RseP (regulator of RpoE activity)
MGARAINVIAAVIALAGSSTGCTHRSPALYYTWRQEIDELPARSGRMDDVSLIVGPDPTCDPVADPPAVVGVTVASARPVIVNVLPDEPAEQAGFRPGDVITAIGGHPVVDGEQALSFLRTHALDGQPLPVTTERGDITVTPRRAKTEQCCWRVRAAGVDRVFRAFCRVVDGFVFTCQSGWRE